VSINISSLMMSRRKA